MQPAGSPAERRRLQNRSEVRRTILDATESLLFEGGYEQFSMRKLAARCGYTPPTIYHHFGDKKRLLDELLEERMAELVARLRQVPVTGDPLGDMRAMFLEFARWGLDNPNHYQLLTARRDPDADAVPSGEEAREMLLKPLIAVYESGRMRFHDLATARQAFWVLLHGLVSLPRMHPHEEWANDLVATSLDAMLRGSLAEGE
jgi:AcrR family transcriptional regulator